MIIITAGNIIPENDKFDFNYCVPLPPKRFPLSLKHHSHLPATFQTPDYSLLCAIREKKSF